MVGPLISEAQRERVEGYIASGRRAGARLVVGGGRPSEHERGYFVEPTLFADVDNRMTIAQEEIFGPVVAVIPYSGRGRGGGDRQRLALRPLRQRLERRRRACASGWRGGCAPATSGVNHFMLDIGGPFGGFKHSGLGREYGLEGIDEYVELQQVTAPRTQPAASLRRRTSSSSVLAAQSSVGRISSPSRP